MAELQKATFNLEARTPLWTGGPDQTCADRIFETGVIGSLRWWLEACARGAGLGVPDPTRGSALRPEELDPVSRIFGATGWRRRFRLTVTGGGLAEIPREVRIKTGAHPDPRKRGSITEDSVWYYGKGSARAWNGRFALHILQTAPWSERDGLSMRLFQDLLDLVSRFGMLGAKAQLGLGIVSVGTDSSYEGPALGEWLQMQRRAGGGSGELPSLHDMVFAEGAAPAKNAGESDGEYWGRTTFCLKHGVRRRFDLRKSLTEPDVFREVRHRLAGETGEVPVKSKVFISHPYLAAEGVRRRVCAWLPPSLCHEYEGRRPAACELKTDLKDEVEDFLRSKSMQVTRGSALLEQILGGGLS